MVVYSFTQKAGLHNLLNTMLMIAAFIGYPRKFVYERCQWAKPNRKRPIGYQTKNRAIIAPFSNSHSVVDFQEYVANKK